MKVTSAFWEAEKDDSRSWNIEQPLIILDQTLIVLHVPLLRSLMCRFDIIMEENQEVAFRPLPCDSHFWPRTGLAFSSVVDGGGPAELVCTGALVDLQAPHWLSGSSGRLWCCWTDSRWSLRSLYGILQELNEDKEKLLVFLFFM